MTHREGLHSLYNHHYGNYAIVGNEPAIRTIEEWFLNLRSTELTTGTQLPMLMISGGSGVGKTHFTQLIAHRHNYLVKTSHALDVRNAIFLKGLLKDSHHKEMSIVDNEYVVVKKRVIVLIDDVDSDTTFSMSTIVDHLKQQLKLPPSKITPVIMICNNPLESRFSGIFPKLVEHAAFNRLCHTHMKVICNRVECTEFLQLTNSAIYPYTSGPTDPIMNNLINEANGDARHLLNLIDFYRISERRTLTERHPPSPHQPVNPFNHRDLSCRIENNHILWGIYNNTLNADISVNGIIHLAGMEQNWIVNGMWENYLDTVSQQPSKQHELESYSDIADMFSFANTTFEKFDNTYPEFNTLQTYVQLLSILPLRNLAHKKHTRIDTSAFRFPSYFGKISNNRIIRSVNYELIHKITHSFPCIHTPSRFTEIVIEPIIKNISEHNFSNTETTPRESVTTHMTHHIQDTLESYNLTINDFFKILRPFVFGMQDNRKKISIRLKNNLKTLEAKTLPD